MLRERPGGVVGTSTRDGFVREHAVSSFFGGPPRGALALCRELGVAVDKASPQARRRWLYLDGKLRALPTNPVELVTTGAVGCGVRGVRSGARGSA
jgi:protoporphyrinogen oxidase